MGRLRNKKALRARRRDLRNALTPAEAKLWTLLRASSLSGFKFRRQHSIGPYIVDFFCPKRNLVVELDGQGHFNPEAQKADHRRTLYLNRLGVKVLRFENRLVFEQEEWVLEKIRRSLAPSSPSSPNSPP